MSDNTGTRKVLEMPPDSSPDRIEPGQPESMIVKLDSILEPELAARCSMSDESMAELVESMDELGQLEPILLVRRGDLFEIVDGHRRFLAARQLMYSYRQRGETRWTCLRCEVYPENYDKLLAARLHATIVREDLNPAEEAVFMAQALQQYGLDLAGLCKLFHRSESYVNARFALLNGDKQVMQAVADKRITMSAAHQLNRIKSDKWRAHYLDCAVKSNPPGHVVEGWVREWNKMEKYLEQQTMPVIEQPAPPEPEIPQRCCAFCGGYLDPGNLVDVTVHRYEWERFIQELRKAQGVTG